MLIKLLRQEKIIAPLTLSYFLIFASQGVRLAYGYKIYVQLLFLPVFLTGVLICASMLTKHADDNDFAGRFERGKIRPRALYYLLFILLLLLIGLRLIGILWGKNYLSPLFEAQYISGNAHVDTLFHSALSNMIMNFGRPSIGVEGLPIIHYHFASHILIGSIGKLFGVGAYEAYNLIAPVFLMPLFLGLLLNLIDVAQKILKIDVNQDRMTIFSLAFFYLHYLGFCRMRSDKILALGIA